MAQSSPRYGKPNFEMLKTWIGRSPEDDGPFWALNLMKYRVIADYQDGRGAPISGREADDAYAPLGPLAAVGAMVAFHGDVSKQSAGEPHWDRIAIVRYPTRAAFFAMQQRDDFKRQHVHKDAGMESTIVMSCLPDPDRSPITTPDGTLTLRVGRVSEGHDLPEVEGAVRVATFDVEGVIVGDDRTWSRVAFDTAPTDAIADALLGASMWVEEMFAMALAEPAIDAIDKSIRTARTVAVINGRSQRSTFRRGVVGVLAAAAVTAGCASSSAKSSVPAASSSTTSQAPAHKAVSALRTKRYCEVLLVRIGRTGVTADVYNSYPLNACPQSKWAKLDTKAIAAKEEFPVAILNGPRYWLMDSIDKTSSKQLQIRKTFGGITMIRQASVAVGPLATATKPYTLHNVDRSTTFTFDAGRTIYELHAPTGATYVMQSWSRQIDRALSETDLAGLGSRLHLPPGWTYRTRVLDAPLRVVTKTTDAQVLQDNLDNSYSHETGN